MNKYQELQKLEGLQLIPINDKKIPLVSGWQTSTEKHDMSSCFGVGLVCNGGLTAIDFDLKYDLTGTLFERYKNVINSIDPNLLRKMVVQKTTSNGYHMVFKSSVIEGNKKLAQRHANEEEKAKGEKIKVLLETRGEKGYIAISPTPGYKLIFGSWDKIQTITEEERAILLDTARDFNEVIKEFKPKVILPKKQIKGLTPFEDYNERGDVMGLLEKHGWEAVGQKGSKTLYKRPGDTTALHSGNFDNEKNWFSVFSSSTEFEPETSYLPYAVYAFLECNQDFSEASKRLYNEGYGDRFESAKENDVHIPSRISETDDDYSFVVENKDIEEYMHKVRTGTLMMGKKTGVPKLDKHFLFKDNSLVVLNGLDNVGKTTIMMYLPLLDAIFNDASWILYSSENGHGSLYRRLIELYWGEPIDKINETKYQKGKEFIDAHFTIIKSDEQLYNYKDILVMSSKLLKRKKYSGILIDPYNSLKIDMPPNYKLSTHDYHYEAISEIKLWTKHNCSVYVNTHPHTAAGRASLEVELDDGSKVKLQSAPGKSDSEGGNKFPNKADDFITIHRYTDHPTEWMFTELHIRKIKEVETGGKVTPINAPVRLKMNPNQCGFTDEEGFDAIETYHKRTPEQQEFRTLPENKSFLQGDTWEEESKVH